MSRHSGRARQHRSEYPLATVASYGPDASRATKLVVSIVERPGARDDAPMRTWTSETSDVRHDPAIAREVVDFIAKHGARRTVTADRIIGCPHQEGIDYPLGRTCPRCPFWLGIDRFTHEPIRRPAPTIPIDRVLRILGDDDVSRLDQALDAADGHREGLVSPLLEVLDRGLADPQRVSDEDSSLFSYALYLFAKWREPRAYPHVIRWLSLGEDDNEVLTGDVITDDGGRILASVYADTIEPIVGLILNRDADEYGRAEGVTALALLAHWLEVPRNVVIERFRWLLREGLEREPSVVWGTLALDAIDLKAVELYPDLRAAFEQGLIEEDFVGISELDAAEAAAPGTTSHQYQRRWMPIDDVLEATSLWRRNTGGEQGDELGEADSRPEPYRAPPKVGRNEPCPCGSGKKFKKCHGDGSRAVH
jgi:hypothetical protein